MAVINFFSHCGVSTPYPLYFTTTIIDHPRRGGEQHPLSLGPLGRTPYLDVSGRCLFRSDFAKNVGQECAKGIASETTFSWSRTIIPTVLYSGNGQS